jgi:tetratricopeptide (TPR) repeat protein
MDADRDASWDLKSKYQVGGYPTVIFADAEGDELGRIVGYRKPEEFITAVEKAWAARDQSFEKLLAQAKKGDSNAGARAGKILLERKSFEEALAVLPATPEYAQDRLSAEIGVLEKAETKGTSGAREKLVASLEKAVAAFPMTSDSVLYRARLAELTQDSSYLVKAAESAEQLAKKPDLLKGLDWTPADLLQTAAGYREELEQKKEAQALWRQAAQLYKKEVKSPNDRGTHLELAYCLWKSGDVTAATRIYERFEKKFPQEFTFYYGHASMLFGLKRAADAEKLARKALEFAYGDNRLRTAGLLAKSLKAQDKHPEARATIREAIEAAKLPADIEARLDQGVRTFRYVKALLELEKQLKPEA